MTIRTFASAWRHRQRLPADEAWSAAIAALAVACLSVAVVVVISVAIGDWLTVVLVPGAFFLGVIAAMGANHLYEWKGQRQEHTP